MYELSLRLAIFQVAGTTQVIKISDLLWEEIVLVFEKKKIELEAEGQESANFLRSLEQFIETVKGQNNFW